MTSWNMNRIGSMFKYHAAVFLAEDIPPTKVRAELLKEGWTFGSSLTPDEALAVIKAGPMDNAIASLPVAFPRIYSPEGKQVFVYGGDEALNERYMTAVKKAASKVYGYTPGQ